MMKKVLFVIITIVALLFTFFSCERMFDNPYDANSNKDTWAPDSVDYFVISANECELSWKLDEDRIDGFKIDKFVNNNWITNYTVLGKDSRTWQDQNYNYDANKPVKYRIFAYAGQNQSTIKEVIVNPELPQLVIDSIFDITDNSMTFSLKFSTNGYSQILSYGICWGSSDNPDTTNNIIVFNDNIPNSLPFSIQKTVEGFIPSTNYYIRAFAINVSGLNYSSNKKISTFNGMPTVLTVNVHNVTPTSAIISGYIFHTGGLNIVNKGVCWSENPNPSISDNQMINSNDSINFSCKIYGLKQNALYYSKAFATNELGTSYGHEISFTTNDFANCGVITDIRDGNSYQTVLIGEQCWMAENLKYLPSVVDAGIGSNTTPYYYVYGYDGASVSAAKSTANYTTYGVLYNWPAAMNSSASSSANPSGVQGVCPTGWHLPSDAEWTELTDYLGGESVAGGKLKETGTTHWTSPNTGATNETGFTALPGGFRDLNGYFYIIGHFGYWWSATESDATSAWGRTMGGNYGTVFRDGNDKEVGFSVRCLRD